MPCCVTPCVGPSCPLPSCCWWGEYLARPRPACLTPTYPLPAASAAQVPTYWDMFSIFCRLSSSSCLRRMDKNWQQFCKKIFQRLPRKSRISSIKIQKRELEICKGSLNCTSDYFHIFRFQRFRCFKRQMEGKIPGEILYSMWPQRPDKSWCFPESKEKKKVIFCTGFLCYYKWVHSVIVSSVRQPLLLDGKQWNWPDADWHLPVHPFSPYFISRVEFQDTFLRQIEGEYLVRLCGLSDVPPVVAQPDNCY